MNNIDQHILDYFAGHPNQGAGAIPSLAGGRIPRQTLSRRLSALVEKGELIRVGQGPASRYLRADVETYFQIPAVHRPPVPYVAARASSGLPGFTPAQLESLRKAAGEHGATAEDTARAVRERLLIELSFASSSLEGNTYDLIQTEALVKYGQVAQGKTAHEAKMILNHRDAIHYLLDNIATLAVDWATLRDIHALLSDGLLDEAADSGRIRRRLVAITHSAYTPLDNEYQIREALEAMLAAVHEEPEPFNRSLMLLAGIPYIQIFADCNKRTGRLMASLPLLQASLPPLSFITVDKEAYTRGLLTYYELGNGRLLAQAYADAYPSSADAYRLNSHRRSKSPEQMAVEVRYQAFVRTRLRDIILGRIESHAPLPDSIPVEDREVVARMIGVQLESLHPGRAAPLGVTSAEVEIYLLRPA
jgi:Fic family protein